MAKTHSSKDGLLQGPKVAAESRMCKAARLLALRCPADLARLHGAPSNTSVASHTKNKRQSRVVQQAGRVLSRRPGRNLCCLALAFCLAIPYEEPIEKRHAQACGQRAWVA